MIQAHDKNYGEAAVTLARSWSQAWIHRGRFLARRVATGCVKSKAKRAELEKQHMGDLPIECCNPGTRPFVSVCLDLLGPISVRSMVNKRATMKTWPILMVCQATGAVHTELMNNYGASAFLLQWNRFTALQGDPSLAVSDCGSQLTSGKNNIAFPEREAPGNWNWNEVHAIGA